MAVTMDNLDQYIQLTKEKIYDVVVKGTEKQAKAFLEGFRKVVDLKYVRKFSPEELRKLAEGGA